MLSPKAIEGAKAWEWGRSPMPLATVSPLKTVYLMRITHLQQKSLIPISVTSKSQRMGPLRDWGVMALSVPKWIIFFPFPFYFYYFQNSSLSLAEEFPRLLQEQCWQATAFSSWVDSYFCEVRTANRSTYQGTGWWKRIQKVQLFRGRGPWTLVKGNRMESVYILLWVFTIFSPFLP